MVFEVFLSVLGVKLNVFYVFWGSKFNVFNNGFLGVEI